MSTLGKTWRSPLAECPTCLDIVAVRIDGTFRYHGTPQHCPESRQPAPTNVMCDHCGGRGWLRNPSAPLSGETEASGTRWAVENARAAAADAGEQER